MTYVIGTAGHVDHGKSTLVKALTGIDPDRLAEEKAREMTIDLGFAWMTLSTGETVGIIDVPGHRDFIENMLAGVGGIDLALFVVAADEGVMPQTREHLAILDLLEIPGGVVALTKIDTISDPEWIDLVTLDLAEALKGTVLGSAPILPVSARSGVGLDRLRAALETALAGRSPRPDRGKPRLPVDRVFTISGFGTVVTGTLTDGAFHVGDEVEVVPAGRRARIRGLQSHKETIEVALPGSRVAVNLSGLTTEDVRRGDVIALPGLLSPAMLIDVRFRHLADTGRPLRHNAEVKFFSGAAETMAYARLLGHRELPPGAEGWLQLRLAEPLALDRGDRFILRYPSPPQTIGGGVVLDPHPPHRWRRFKDEVLDRFEMLATGTPEEILLHTLESQTALTSAQAASLTGLSSDEVIQAAAALQQQGEIMVMGDQWLVARASWTRLIDHMVRELSEYHRQFPLKAGMPREALRSRLSVEARLFGVIVNQAIESGLVVSEGTIIRRPDHGVRFTTDQQTSVDRLLGLCQANPVATPSVKEATELIGEDVLQVLIERGDLVQVAEDVLFDAQTYHDLVQQIEQFITAQGAITVAQARDLFGTTRKYALALLEHLDAIGFTKRVGDERVLRRPGL